MSEITTASARKPHRYWVDLADGDLKKAKSLRAAAYGKTDAGKATSKRSARTVRISCLVAYSGPVPHCQCECGCHVNNVVWLTIDHINGGGTKERKTLKRGGTGFFRWLRQHNFPAGYRVLCYNCNCGCARQKSNNIIHFENDNGR